MCIVMQTKVREKLNSQLLVDIWNTLELAQAKETKRASELQNRQREPSRSMRKPKRNVQCGMSRKTVHTAFAGREDGSEARN